MPRGKYLRNQHSLKDFITPLPTDTLFWLAKMAPDEIAVRNQTGKPSKSETEPQRLQPHDRTLR